MGDCVEAGVLVQVSHARRHELGHDRAQTVDKDEALGTVGD